MSEQIKKKLNDLAEYRAHFDVLELNKQELIDSVLTPEIKTKIAEIEVEFADKTITIREAIQRLEDEIREDVVEAGETVKGDHLNAVFMKGRVSWDTKGLDGFALTHPEILYMREEGKPSVSIRKV